MPPVVSGWLRHKDVVQVSTPEVPPHKAKYQNTPEQKKIEFYILQSNLSSKTQPEYTRPTLHIPSAFIQHSSGYTAIQS